MSLISSKRSTSVCSMPLASILVLSAGLMLAPIATVARAQSTAAIRITEAVDNASRVTLAGNVHPLARPRYDRGVAAPELPANRLTLVLKRSDQQEVALRQFLDAAQDSKSPLYHKYLTPEQFGKQYGPSDADLQTVTNWLGSQGFTVAKVNKGRTAIEFSGTAGQVQKAFRTSIHSYVVNGEQHYANASDPQIPSALAPVVAGIAALNNFKPHRLSQVVGQARLDRTTHKAMPLFNDPSFNNNGVLQGFGLAVVPGDFNMIYDTAPLLRTSVDGTGVTIAIAGDSNIDPTFVQSYRANFLPNYNPTAFSQSNVIIDGNDPGINGDAIEAYLDVEVAGGVAPKATVNLYIASGTNLTGGLELAVQRAIEDNTASILNISFGNSEAALGTAGNQNISNLYEQAAAQGITVLVSSGDSGSAGADDPNTETSAVNGLQVSGFASTPFNVAVGGTDFTYPQNVTSAQLSQYWNQSTATSAGNNADFSSARQYIPEQPWNNSNAALAQPNSNFQANIVAAGGGASNCAQSTTVGNNISCSAGYPKPSWQVGPGVPSDSLRDLPDISLFAANGANFSYWAICASAANGVNDCAANGGPNTLTQSQVIQITGIGGTSASSPAMAGIMAMVVQQYGRQGQANTVLYKLAAQSPSVFHDVTVGNNAVGCAGGSLNCAATATGTTGFLSGYAAGPGYDQASGLGSIDANVLVNSWNSVVTTPTTTALTVTPTTVNLNDTVTFTVTVLPGSGTGTPTGDIAILTNSSSPAEGGQVVQTLPAGKNTVTLTYSGLPGSGTPSAPYQLTARYAGDGTFASSTSTPVTMTVNPTASKIYIDNANVYVVASNSLNVQGNLNGATSVAYGSYIGFDSFPVPNSYTPPTNNTAPVTARAHGSISVTDNSSALGTLPLDANGSATFFTSGTAPGAHSIVVSYAGDSSYGASTSASPLTFTVVKAPNTVSLSPSATSVPASGSVVVTATLATNSYGVLPTGTVTFLVGTTALPAASISSSYDKNTGAATATATVTILGSQLNSVIRTTARLEPRNNQHQNGSRWWAAEGGLALASVLLFSIPARRRGWRALLGSTLGALCFLILAGSLGACGGGGGGSTPTPTPTPTPTTSSITANYSGDGNYAASTAAAITITNTH